MLQAELFALYALALVLPNFEAPKNVLWIAYGILWIANRTRSQNTVGGPWNAWDTMIFSWISSGYLAAAYAGLHNSEWLSAFDIVRYGLLLWMLKRSKYDNSDLEKVLACLLAGTAAALARGAYELWITKEHASLGLNSVGHVNHSAIFLAIALLAAIAWVRAGWVRASFPVRGLGLLMTVAFALGLVAMASRGAVGAAFVAAMAFLVAYSIRSGKPLKGILVAAAVVAGIVLAVKPQVVEKNEARLKENLFLAHRDRIWRTGFEAWRTFPAFGVGMGNFGRIDLALLKEWSSARDEALDPSKVTFASHGHSLYVNTLAERGLVGLAALFAILGAWAWSLARYPPSGDSPPIEWAYWGGALGAWMVAVIVGLVNTTLHHEHALVSVILLGGWLSLRARGPKAR